MRDESDIDHHDWVYYDDFALERNELQSRMLEHFEIGGPGPPFEFPEPPVFFLPPPPIPGTVDECVPFSSHIESCDIFKVNIGKYAHSFNLFSMILVLKSCSANIIMIFCLYLLALINNIQE